MNDMSMPDMTVVVEENALLARIYARMPLDVQMSFTPEQIAALGAATYDPPTPHKVAIRRVFGMFGKRYYFALFMGRDRRGNRESFVPVNEFRADWRYVVSVLGTLGLIFALIALAATQVWLYAASAVGGPYRPVSFQEFTLPGLSDGLKRFF
ncbi:MAG: hypothetical protein B7Z29_07285 [Hyphomicrobium sp. 12-62-95]|nr:MAG: hypothetical protein B7Z29_07285 [Hyphomicrobium sp. 12-62-95]